MATVNNFPLETKPLAEVYQTLNFALYKAVSTTSLLIGTGTKVFTVQAGKDFAAGDFVLATSDANVANYMEGRVVSYSGTTLTLSVPASNYTGGSGTFADWTLRTAGPAGATGAAGASFAATSTSSQTIGSSGTKTFTTQAGLAYQAGTRVRAASSAAPTTTWMEGVVGSYSSTTLVFTADKSLGSGTLASWVINVAGEPGAAGSGGDFSGPASSVSGNIVSFSGTGGKTGQDSGVAAASVVVGPASATSGNLASYSGTTGKIVQDSALATTNVAVKNANNSFSADQTVSVSSAGATQFTVSNTNVGAGAYAGFNVTSNFGTLNFIQQSTAGGGTTKMTIPNDGTFFWDMPGATGGSLIVRATNSSTTLLTIGPTAITAAAKVTTSASTTTRAGMNITHGAAPSSPVDGDMWTTTAGLFVRINGVTKTVTLT